MEIFVSKVPSGSSGTSKLEVRIVSTENLPEYRYLQVLEVSLLLRSTSKYSCTKFSSGVIPYPDAPII